MRGDPLLTALEDAVSLARHHVREAADWLDRIPAEGLPWQTAGEDRGRTAERIQELLDDLDRLAAVWAALRSAQSADVTGSPDREGGRAAGTGARRVDP